MKNLILLTILFFSVQSAYAFPINQLSANDNPFFTIDPQKALNDPAFTKNYDFEGIVSLRGCSGSLVRFEQSRNSDNAMVLTNGHCLGRFPAPGKIIENQSDRRAFGVLNPQGRNLGRVRAKRIIYGTMTKTDMALFELQDTYEDIFSKFNVRPLTLSSRKANINDRIEIVSGYWKRGYSCHVEKFIHQLKEDKWTMEDSIRYSRPGCRVIGGTSGSPIILADSRTVIGVNNTGNESGRTCTMNNPCEVDENGKVSAHKGYSYGQQTYWIYSCLSDQLKLDLNKPGCQLHH